jgi:3-oxoacyl-[acyl-carrier protein] reductase
VSDDSQEFGGRVALVTGGARGIGRATCRLLARRGARIALNYLSSAEAAAETKRMIEDAGGECRLYQADAADEAAFGAAVAAIRREMGPISHLVANAGTTKARHHSELTFAIWRETMRNNLDSAFVSVAAVKDEMLAQGFGTIVCLSSIGALRPRPKQIDYCAAKAGVIGMVRCLADALSPTVRVNAVAPGLTETDMIAELDQSILPGRIADTPLKRMAKPDEVAEAIAFLLSERSSFITGDCMTVSGGAVMVP